MGFYWNSNVRQEDLDSDLEQDLERSDNDTGTEEEEYEFVESDNEENEALPLFRAKECSPSDNLSEDTDEELDGDNDTGEDDTGYNTFQVWTPSTRTARKTAFDGVVVPPRKGLAKRSEVAAGDKPITPNTRAAAARVPETKTTRKPPQVVSGPVKKKAPQEVLPEQRPYDARSERQFARPSPGSTHESTPSSLQHKKPRAVVPQGAQVISSVGEIMAISKDVRTLTTNHFKTQYPWSEDDGVLIKIDMEIGGRPVVAVIDTGSQLDVIREDVADRILHQPIDLSKSIMMNDANGGESTHGKFIC
ncbi:hypothetical protein C8R47DRAFT_1094610, partial [Mycena vitilis]